MGVLKTLKIFKTAYSIADSIIKSESNVSFNGDYSSWFNGVSALLTSQGECFQTEAYNTCSPLQSIINKKAQSITKGVIIPVDSDGNEIEKAPVGFNNAIKVINNPNDYQSKDEFLRTLETFINVYGVSYVFKVSSLGFSGVKGMIILPNSCVNVQYTTNADILANDSNNIIDNIQVSLSGTTYIFRGEDLEKIYTVQDVTVNLANPILPKSRIDSLRYSIENIVASQESRNTIIVKRGADGMLSPEKSSDNAVNTIGLQDNAVNKIQSDYAKYGQLKDQFHTLITKVPMKYTAMTKSVADLGLFEGEKQDVRTIAFAYGVPTPLLGLPDDKKYDSYVEAKREFYEDAIIPESDVIAQMYNDLFEAKDYSFKFDYSHLSFMQESRKEDAEVFGSIVDSLNSAVSGELITVEQAREKLQSYE